MQACDRPRRPGRRSCKPGRANLSANLILRNIGLAIVLGDRFPVTPMRIGELCKILGMDRSTIHRARKSNELILRIFATAKDEPETRALRNAKRRRSKPADGTALRGRC